jgi:polar amino acid transport system substrate-binding protein
MPFVVRWVAPVLVAIITPASQGQARSLEMIQAQGVMAQCVHPNALPYSSRKDGPPGFQIELGSAIAKQIGVVMEPLWIIGGHQLLRVRCDIVTDAIAQPEIQEETRLQLSKPYHRTGIVLAVRLNSAITGADAIDRHAKIGVIGSSIASMTFNQRGLTTSTFGFEDEMLAALAANEIDGAVVNRGRADYYNLTHPRQAVRTIQINQLSPGFTWNVAVGMVKPDARLRDAIDKALDSLIADGSIKRIYAKYGIDLQSPP